jgi:hypothetical protein
MSDWLSRASPRSLWSAQTQFVSRGWGREVTATALLEPLPYPEDPNVVIVAMLTPGQAADLFIGDITRRGYSDRTVDTYRRILYKLCDRLPPDYHVGQITTDDCRRFLDQWNRHSAGTRVHTFSVLASFMEWLVFSEKIKRSPLATMSRPKRSRPDDLDVVTITRKGCGNCSRRPTPGRRNSLSRSRRTSAPVATPCLN